MRTLLAPRDAITKPLAVTNSAITIAAAYSSYVLDLADMKFARPVVADKYACAPTPLFKFLVISARVPRPGGGQCPSRVFCD
jgi:hypothetical protein